MQHDFTVHMRAFMRAAELAGGAQTLAERLCFPKSQVHRWISGEEQVPTAAFLKIVDFLIECDLRDMARSVKPPRP
jgi:DNA-binding transcriptional regulator YdaS (Cro superfamily)